MSHARWLLGIELSALLPEFELERGMLEFAFDAQESSRLSCQIDVTEEMEGMRVRMPARQLMKRG